MNDRFSLEGRVASSPAAAPGSDAVPHWSLPSTAPMSCSRVAAPIRWNPLRKRST